MKYHWIYCIRLFSSKFQANVLATRIEEDWWIKEYKSPHEVEVFQTNHGRYGVRYRW